MSKSKYWKIPKKCPFCKAEETIAVYEYPDGTAIACAECMVMTPRAKNFEKTLKYWNALKAIKKEKEEDNERNTNND